MSAVDSRPSRWLSLACLLVVAAAKANGFDPRVREVVYDPNAVITVWVKRGVVTDVVLGIDEQINEVGSGLGADCSKAEAAWCIAAQAGGRHLFVKPKSGASAPNNVAVVSDRRVHSFRFVVLPDRDPRLPVYRLTVLPASTVGTAVAKAEPRLTLIPLQPIPATPAPEDVVAQRLAAQPRVLNSSYSIAEGEDSEDIVPALVFDDGRFTYFRFPGNREVPAVFHVAGDGSETLVNTRMEGDLLVVDRVSRRLVLRSGRAVVGIWNEAFDIDGRPPVAGTTVPGISRTLKAAMPGAVQEGRLP